MVNITNADNIWRLRCVTGEIFSSWSQYFATLFLGVVETFSTHLRLIKKIWINDSRAIVFFQLEPSDCPGSTALAVGPQDNRKRQSVCDLQWKNKDI